MVEDELYDVFWTPDFTEDVLAAVSYIAEELGSPQAAQDLLAGVSEKLEIRRQMPMSAPSYKGPTGQVRYVISYKRFDIYYVIEGSAIKAIGLKHQLQDGRHGILPRENDTE